MYFSLHTKVPTNYLLNKGLPLYLFSNIFDSMNVFARNSYFRLFSCPQHRNIFTSPLQFNFYLREISRRTNFLTLRWSWSNVQTFPISHKPNKYSISFLYRHNSLFRFIHHRKCQHYFSRLNFHICIFFLPLHIQNFSRKFFSFSHTLNFTPNMTFLCHWLSIHAAWRSLPLPWFQPLNLNFS